jgi:hypothetical protein
MVLLAYVMTKRLLALGLSRKTRALLKLNTKHMVLPYKAQGPATQIMERASKKVPGQAIKISWAWSIFLKPNPSKLSDERWISLVLS